MTSVSAGIWDVTKEFSRARIADKRLLGRTASVMAALARSPGDSFPDAMGSEKALEGLYRLLNNPRVNHTQLLESHVLTTAERAKAAGDVLAVHDTTTCKFSHLSPEELGELNTSTAGFLAHTTLLLDATVERCPLGVISLRTIHREPGRQRRDLSGSECAKLDNKESARWFEAVRETEAQLFGKARVLHVMDREGDSYELYARLVARSSRFVIRGDDRTCLFDGERSRIKDVLSKQRVVAERDVPLSKRTTRTQAPKSARPVREARMAQLSIAGCRLTLKAPKYLGSELPQQITLNVAHVFEANPPVGEAPVEWFLLTTEPIETDEQLLRVVDIYRQRWVIEEFFKALKTGCLYSERQLESREALLNVLVLFLPIACQLLWLRSRGRTHPDASAEGMVTKTQEQVIRRFSSRTLPASPTVRELIWAIAAIGGHLKSNGEPGWQVLGRAWTRVLEYEAVWLAAAATFQKSVIS
jgi:hypothetical protein